MVTETFSVPYGIRIVSKTTVIVASFCGRFAACTWVTRPKNSVPRSMTTRPSSPRKGSYSTAVTSSLTSLSFELSRVWSESLASLPSGIVTLFGVLFSSELLFSSWAFAITPRLMSIAANNAIESSLFIICLLRTFRASWTLGSDLFDRPVVGLGQTRQFALALGRYQRFFWSLRKTSLTSWSRSFSRSERLSSNSLAPEARQRSLNAPSLDFFISRRPSSKSISTAAPPPATARPRRTRSRSRRRKRPHRRSHRWYFWICDEVSNAFGSGIAYGDV